jgi:hypothetical protein
MRVHNRVKDSFDFGQLRKFRAVQTCLITARSNSQQHIALAQHSGSWRGAVHKMQQAHNLQKRVH